ncbi:MAG: nucleoside hydrolase [Anaerolineaceae bacterium]|nr:nucleoside hydrolase [Anaerolineaceae bacterium]
MQSLPIIIDTDISLGTPGAEIDDGAAIISLCNSPEVDLRGVCLVHGNVSLEEAAHNARRLLSYLKRNDVPLALGSAQALKEDSGFQQFWTEWKQERFGETPSWQPETQQKQNPSALEMMTQLLNTSAQKVTLLAIGPLTNIAELITKHPELRENVQEIVSMGGTFSSQGSAEFNIRCDPEAAQIVFQSGWPMRVLGLEITRQMLFTRAHFRDLADQHQDNPALQLLNTQAQRWIKTVEENDWEIGGCSLHDAVAAMALLDESLFIFQPARIEIETDFDMQRGATRITALQSGQQSNLSVSSKVNVEACHRLIMDRLVL